jgi:hypothetical protein
MAGALEQEQRQIAAGRELPRQDIQCAAEVMFTKRRKNGFAEVVELGLY